MLNNSHNTNSVHDQKFIYCFLNMMGKENNIFWQIQMPIMLVQHGNVKIGIPIRSFIIEILIK